MLYHSETGNTRRMAELVAQGVTLEDPGGVFDMRLVDVVEAGEEELEFLADSRVVFVGCPTYYGTISWQMKRFLDTLRSRGVNLAGKIGASFSSANWPGGGGYELTCLALVQVLLIKGVLVYTGGIKAGRVPTHFGAVSRKKPKGFDADRCVQLGSNVAKKALELWG